MIRSAHLNFRDVQLYNYRCIWIKAGQMWILVIFVQGPSWRFYVTSACYPRQKTKKVDQALITQMP